MSLMDRSNSQTLPTDSQGPSSCAATPGSQGDKHGAASSSSSSSSSPYAGCGGLPRSSTLRKVLSALGVRVTTSSSRQIAQCASIAKLKQRVETAVANVDRSALLLSLRHALSDQQVLRWLLRPLKELAARHSGGGGKSSSSASASASLPTLAASSDDSVVLPRRVDLWLATGTSNSKPLAS